MADNIVSMFKQRVLGILNSPEVRFILFGSRGRGEAEEYSDYDFLIITSKNESNANEKIEEIETDIFINHSAIINSHLLSEDELKRFSFEPFVVNALTEGVAA